eukprot:GSA120T00007509001.1
MMQPRKAVNRILSIAPDCTRAASALDDRFDGSPAGEIKGEGPAADGHALQRSGAPAGGGKAS